MSEQNELIPTNKFCLSTVYHSEETNPDTNESDQWHNYRKNLIKRVRGKIFKKNFLKFNFFTSSRFLFLLND